MSTELPLYGILKSINNTGVDSEILTPFSAPLVLINNAPAFVTDSLSLRRSVSSQGVQRWEIETELVSTVGSVDQFLHGILNRSENKFYIRMPPIPFSEQLALGKTLTNLNTITKGSKDLNVTGLTGDQLCAGEFIQFAGDNKIYVITDPGENGLGAQFYPPAVLGKTIGTAIKYGSIVTGKQIGRAHV